jgi:hypothetical protein
LKFACDRCGKRFNSTDEPVPGRVYRIKCKCGNLLLVKGPDPGEASATPARTGAKPLERPTSPAAAAASRTASRLTDTSSIALPSPAPAQGNGAFTSEPFVARPAPRHPSATPDPFSWSVPASAPSPWPAAYPAPPSAPVTPAWPGASALAPPLPSPGEPLEPAILTPPAWPEPRPRRSARPAVPPSELEPIPIPTGPTNANDEVSVEFTLTDQLPAGGRIPSARPRAARAARPRPAPAPTPAKRQRFPFVAFAGGVGGTLAVAAIAGWFFLRSRVPPPEAGRGVTGHAVTARSAPPASASAATAPPATAPPPSMAPVAPAPPALAQPAAATTSRAEVVAAAPTPVEPLPRAEPAVDPSPPRQRTAREQRATRLASADRTEPRRETRRERREAEARTKPEPPPQPRTELASRVEPRQEPRAQPKPEPQLEPRPAKAVVSDRGEQARPVVAAVTPPPPPAAAAPKVEPPRKKEEVAVARAEERPAAAAAAAPPKQLEPSDVLAVIKGTRGGFDTCVKEAVQAPGMQGLLGRKFGLFIVVNPSGRTTQATIDEPEIETAPVGGCLRRVAEKMVFPQFSGDPFPVRIPLRLGNAG